MFGSKKPDTVGISVEEFWSRWATGRTAKFAVPSALEKIPGDDASPTIYDLVERPLEVCDAPYGDFIAAYVEHIGIPPRYRRDDWAQVERLFRSNLNRSGAVVRFPRLG